MSMQTEFDVETTRAERKAFEDAAFNQRFLAGVRKIPGQYFMAVDCPTQAEWVAMDENGHYKEESLNPAWWAWLLRAELATEELAVTDALLSERNRLLDAIPECRTHGKSCVPHALNWIEDHRAAATIAPHMVSLDESGNRQSHPTQAKEGSIPSGSATSDAAEVAALTAELDAAKRALAESRDAIIAMTEDGWLYHGPEGMSDVQQKCYQQYLLTEPGIAALAAKSTEQKEEG